jgi:hypothetical protein
MLARCAHLVPAVNVLGEGVASNTVTITSR